jgi:hypothetical protein
MLEYNRAMRPAFAAVILLIIPCAFLQAQSPHQEWKTLETKHFRVHYPAEYEPWTLRLAPKMEAIHEAVTKEVGYDPKETTDILVMDPVSVANGMAIPFLGYPRMILWTTPPESWSPIGHYRDWAELVFLHEDVHLVHLLRPGRGPMARLKEHILPLSPMVLKAPRWVSEGYATYLEGKLTGVGRPNGDFRAAILRKWALEGNLPTYGQMASDGESWLGMSMAYLMGSAYMEWLVQRTDAEGLKRLWARLTAKKDRSFEAAFEGVFGEKPQKLYDRFTAELTWKAVELGRRMKPFLAEGGLWQDTSWTTGEPALSPDGTKMAIVLRAKDEPSRLVVWDTQPDPEAQKRWDEDIARIRKTDPEDVPGLRTKPFPAKVLFKLHVAAAREPINPRWLPDGKSILFTSYEPDLDGFYSPDLFLWTPENGTVRRITRGAHVKEADPFPDGKRAAAVQSRFGANGLVEVDLTSGEVEPLHGSSVDVIYAQPRVGPDGTRVAVVMHANGAWSLMLMDLDQKLESLIPIPEGAIPSFPTWSRDGKSLYASIAAEGFINVHRFEINGSTPPQQVTQTMGAAMAPEPDPSGKGLYFLSLEPDGLDVRYIAFDQAVLLSEGTTANPEFAPAVRPVPPEGLEFLPESVGASKPYGAGRQEFSLLFGGTYAPGARVTEIGVRGGDVLGRWDYFAIYSHAPDKGPDGGAFALAYRGWPVEIKLHVFDVDDHLGSWFVNHYRGAEIRTTKEWTLRKGALNLQAGMLEERRRIYEWFGDYGNQYRLGFLQTKAYGMHPLGEWILSGDLFLREEWVRISGNGTHRFSRDLFEAETGVRHGGSSLSFQWRRHHVRNGISFTDDLTFGGVAFSVLPESAYYGWIQCPAFEPKPATHEHEGFGVRLELAGIPLFYERHRFESPHGVVHWGSWISLAGLEWDATSGPLAIAKLPDFHLTLGGAYVFDPPLEGKTRFWISLSWRP